jgi:hypothetical protein
MRNLHDKTAAPLTELEGEKVKLVIALATEVRERTTKAHVTETRHDDLFECGNHLVTGFAHAVRVETPNETKISYRWLRASFAAG